MSRIKLSELARDDLDEIWFDIASENVPAADRLIDDLDELLQKLLNFPLMGVARDELREGVRSFPCGNYIVFYRPMPYGIAVLRIVYGRRDLQAITFPPTKS